MKVHSEDELNELNWKCITATSNVEEMKEYCKVEQMREKDSLNQQREKIMSLNELNIMSQREIDELNREIRSVQMAVNNTVRQMKINKTLIQKGQT